MQNQVIFEYIILNEWRSIFIYIPVPGKLPEPADNWRWSCKVLAVETLLDRYHSSEKKTGYENFELNS